MSALTPLRCIVSAAALAAAGLSAPHAVALNDNPHASAFVVLYRCDGDHWLAIAYPAPFARASEPVRLSWNGETVILSQARSGSGARYVNRAADLEWWIKGRGGTMRKLSEGSMILANCREG